MTFAEDVKKRFDISNYEIDRPWPLGKNKQVIGLMKDKFGGQIMKKFVGLTAKKYCYLKDNYDEYKKGKETRKYVIYKEILSSEIIKNV